MPQSIEYLLSDEDSQLIEANRLGAPLSIYKIRSAYIHILRGGSLFLIILGIVALIVIFTTTSTGWHSPQAKGDPELAIFGGLSAFSLLAGLFFLRVTTPQFQKTHIIVCEHGLLDVAKWNKRVNVLRWSEVIAIRRFYNEYSITRRDGKLFSLTIMYQNIGELVEVIKLRSGRE